eukprot:jgi/Mesvir1/8877/Mv02768-RA.2
MPPHGLDTPDQHKVWEIRALKKHSDEAVAKKMLEDVARQVQPIMRKRGWRVKMLSEFSPSNPNLLGLNVNRGVEVKIRLRPHNGAKDGCFYPFEHVLGTMLHELTHNAVSPHNAAFYKLLDEITARALKAATARAQKQAIMGAGASGSASGGRRLGGDTRLMRQLTPGEAAARAAERRLQDDLWCGHEEEEGQNDGCSCAGAAAPASGGVGPSGPGVATRTTTATTRIEAAAATTTRQLPRAGTANMATVAAPALKWADTRAAAARTTVTSTWSSTPTATSRLAVTAATPTEDSEISLSMSGSRAAAGGAEVLGERRPVLDVGRAAKAPKLGTGEEGQLPLGAAWNGGLERQSKAAGNGHRGGAGAAGACASAGAASDGRFGGVNGARAGDENDGSGGASLRPGPAHLAAQASTWVDLTGADDGSYGGPLSGEGHLVPWRDGGASGATPGGACGWNASKPLLPTQMVGAPTLRDERGFARGGDGSFDPDIRGASMTSPTGAWACPSCTLVNQPEAPECDACLSARPTSAHALLPQQPIDYGARHTAGATVATSKNLLGGNTGVGTLPLPPGVWACPQCTFHNVLADLQCAVCELVQEVEVW